MSVPARKLTVYFNEALRGEHGLAAAELFELFAAAGLRSSVLLRGIEGFGAHHHLHTERLENASLNQPVVAVAVDERERIEALLPDVQRIVTRGLITTERALLWDEASAREGVKATLHAEAVKLTVYCARARRQGGRPHVRAVLEHLRGSGVGGATAFLGLDGTVHGERRRASFFSRNRDVPVMVIAVGDRSAVGRAAQRLGRVLEAPIATLERVELWKDAGAALQAPHFDARSQRQWRKLMVYAPGDADVDGRPLHFELVEALRRGGTAGATSIRGIVGYRGLEAPRGDAAFSLRRRSPVVTIVIDSDERLLASWPLVDHFTRERGLVTSELVPVYRPLVALSGGRDAA